MGEKVVLYGAGKFGVFAALVLQNRGTAPYCFCDKNTSDGIGLNKDEVFYSHGLIKTGRS